MIKLHVTQCIFNDLRSGDRQWTLVLKCHDGSGELHIYSAYEFPIGHEFEFELAQ